LVGHAGPRGKVVVARRKVCECRAVASSEVSRSHESLKGAVLGETHKYFREYFEIGTRKAKSAALETTKTVKLIESARSQTVIGGRRDDLNDSGSTVLRLRLSVETASRAPRRARRGPGGEGGRATLTASAAFPAGRFVSSCVFCNLDAPRRPVRAVRLRASPACGEARAVARFLTRLRLASSEALPPRVCNSLRDYGSGVDARCNHARSMFHTSIVVQ
jgi:hypothetical protein